MADIADVSKQEVQAIYEAIQKTKANILTRLLCASSCPIDLEPFAPPALTAVCLSFTQTERSVMTTTGRR